MPDIVFKCLGHSELVIKERKLKMNSGASIISLGPKLMRWIANDMVPPNQYF
jgi:hypothetical protein